MFIDARSLSNNTNLDVDLAIIGGGVAGITLARTLTNNKTRVCVIESGDLDFDQQVQSLYEGENSGINYSTTASRLRYFGGSSNHWGGYCRRLDAIDFEARDWVPYSGWPFSLKELMPWYTQASEIVQIARGDSSDQHYWKNRNGEPLLSPVTGRLSLQFVQFSPPTRFGKRYRDELKMAKNIQVLLNANVTNIAATENARHVKQLNIRTLNGLRHTVRARYYVLATGGLENARMLLLSNDVVKAGLGNHNDQVGRYFMEHPHLNSFSEMVAGELAQLPDIFHKRVKTEKGSVQIAFNPDQKFLREKQLLNSTFMMGLAGTYKTDGHTSLADSRTRSHRTMLLAAQRFLRTEDKPSDPNSPGVWFGFGGSCEQVPNPDSRVSLSSQSDRLGLPRLKLDWRLTEQDRLSFYANLRSLALEFGALGIGRMLETIADPDSWPEPVHGGNHHMGTTRMSNNPSLGVVDSNSKVHGVDNLYVAGSSVFPTSGSANPTLTLVALTLRLANHLKGQLR